MRVLVVNAGSSSVKLSALSADDNVAAQRQIDAPHGDFLIEELETALASMPGTDAVGHRVVHGGTRFRSGVRIDARVVAELRDLVDLAPLHQPPALSAQAITERLLPGVPQVACFDTAFHASLGPAAATYAVPRQWAQKWGLRRFGFHGLSHAYAARRAAELTGARRVVTCHLGAGASLAAVADGHSIDTTMGFTPLDGLVMATRSGSVDPGMLLWLLERGHVTVTQLRDGLERNGGLAGLCGDSDMRRLLERDDDEAAVALAVYGHRLRAGIASMTAALGGVESLVFTGGVGEHAAEIRQLALDGLAYLGFELDPARNESPEGDAEIGRLGAPVRILRVRAREDLEIARQVREALR